MLLLTHRLNQNRNRRKLRHRSVTIIQGLRWGRGDKPSIMDLLLSHPRTHPITGADAWELELDQTLKCVGAAFAGVGAGIGGRKWNCRTGMGRKVGAKVSGADVKGSEKGSEEVVGEEKDKDEGKGKGKEEAIEEKGNNEKKKKGAGDEGDESKPDLWTVFDLDPPRHHGPDEQK